MTFYDEPVVEQIGHLWGVWVDDGDELVACSTLSEALTLKQKLIEFRNARRPAHEADACDSFVMDAEYSDICGRCGEAMSSHVSREENGK